VGKVLFSRLDAWQEDEVIVQGALLQDDGAGTHGVGECWGHLSYEVTFCSHSTLLRQDRRCLCTGTLNPQFHSQKLSLANELGGDESFGIPVSLLESVVPREDYASSQDSRRSRQQDEQDGEEDSSHIAVCSRSDHLLWPNFFCFASSGHRITLSMLAPLSFMSFSGASSKDAVND
jgi:hypothetical protein